MKSSRIETIYLTHKEKQNIAKWYTNICFVSNRIFVSKRGQWNKNKNKKKCCEGKIVFPFLFSFSVVCFFFVFPTIKHNIKSVWCDRFVFLRENKTRRRKKTTRKCFHLLCTCINFTSFVFSFFVNVNEIFGQIFVKRKIKQGEREKGPIEVTKIDHN